MVHVEEHTAKRLKKNLQSGGRKLGRVLQYLVKRILRTSGELTGTSAAAAQVTWGLRREACMRDLRDRARGELEVPQH